MNILVPDIWLREYLKTGATPQQIKEYLSLCGPSVERIYGKGKQTVYDIEVTGNRPDAMSVLGIAREAATILPRFGIKATVSGDPYKEKIPIIKSKGNLTLTLKTDPKLNPRWMSVIFDGVTVGPSPKWLRTYLELAGMRSLNNVVDITNFLMRAYGQPAHVFDYDAIGSHTMILRASKKGETLITLDGKRHTLPGNDIVIEDGTGKLIDLCGIMGGENSSVTEKTTRVILFLQTYNPSHIRKTSMALSHRTEAAALFEKGLDTDLVKPVMGKGIQLITEITNGSVAGPALDIYPEPFVPYTVSVSMAKIRAYIGPIDAPSIKSILTSLGFRPTISKNIVTVSVPSYRRDTTLDVDVIEEIARIYGYHEIASVLPETAPPMTQPDRQLIWEDEIKVRLRDWGFTELYTYSMLSEDQMKQFSLDTSKAYTITNPLSSEWVYMRPVLWPSVVLALRQNLAVDPDPRMFELSMVYEYRTNDIPKERPVLAVAWSGNHFAEAKGLTETILLLFGLTYPEDLTPYGTIIANDQYTVVSLFIDVLVSQAKQEKTYLPIPKYPAVVEDLAFTVPERFAIGPLITALKTAHPLVSDVTLLDVHQNTRTLHITYQDRTRNLTNDDIAPVRGKLIALAESSFHLSLKTLK